MCLWDASQVWLHNRNVCPLRVRAVLSVFVYYHVSCILHSSKFNLSNSLVRRVIFLTVLIDWKFHDSILRYQHCCRNRCTTFISGISPLLHLWFMEEPSSYGLSPLHEVVDLDESWSLIPLWVADETAIVLCPFLLHLKARDVLWGWFSIHTMVTVTETCSYSVRHINTLLLLLNIFCIVHSVWPQLI